MNSPIWNIGPVFGVEGGLMLGASCAWAILGSRSTDSLPGKSYNKKSNDNGNGIGDKGGDNDNTEQEQS